MEVDKNAAEFIYTVSQKTTLFWFAITSTNIERFW